MAQTKVLMMDRKSADILSPDLDSSLTDVQNGDIAVENNNILEAVGYYTSHLTRNEAKAINDVYRKRSECYYQLGKCNESLSDSADCLRRNPKSMAAHLLQGKCLAKMKRFDEALLAYKKGLEVDPKDNDIAHNLRQMQKDILEFYNEAQKTSSDTSYNAVKLCSQKQYPGDNELSVLENEILETKGYYELPVIKTGIPDPDAAIKDFVVAKQCIEAGNLYSALKYIDITLEKDPVNFSTWQTRAEILYELQNYKEAFQSCNVVIKQFRSSNVWKLGGKILNALGLPVAAETWFRKSTQLSPEGDDEAAHLFQQVRVGRLYDPLTDGTKVKVKFTQFGRAIFVTQSIAQGEIIFHDSPVILAQTLDSTHVPACSHCAKSMMRPEDYFHQMDLQKEDMIRKAVKQFWPIVEPILCSHCDKEKFCSVKCRDEAWKVYHCVLCPSRNKAVSKLYSVCSQYPDFVKGDIRVWQGTWNASYSPMVLAKIWATIACEAKRQATAADKQQPTSANWSMAMAPYRRFMAYGSTSIAKVIPKMLDIMTDVFRDLGDGLSYQITQREFDGRYFQAACNVQAFCDSLTPLKKFVKNIQEKSKWKHVFDYMTHDAPEANFAGLFALHACLNHSCYNNVEVMDGTSNGVAGVKVRAKRNIQVGEELFTTYIDTKMFKQERRGWLFRAYNFWCNCQRCQYEGDGPEECTNCTVKATEPKGFPACGKCRRAWYCSPKCQKVSWKGGHKKICGTVHSDTTSPSDAYINSTAFV